MKIKNLHIKEFKGLRDISINFEKNDEPLPLIVLAGSNGSGKTRVLESILKYFQDHLNYKQNNIETGIFYEEKEKNCISNVRDFFYGLEYFSYHEVNNPLYKK